MGELSEYQKRSYAAEITNSTLNQRISVDIIMENIDGKVAAKIAAEGEALKERIKNIMADDQP